MKKITILTICFALLAFACAPIVPISERYANQLATTQSLSRHADYFRKEYARTDRDEAYWAYRAIIEGEVLTALYEAASKEAAKKGNTSNQIIENMKFTKDALAIHLANYSSIWSKSIHDSVHYKYSSVEFTTALSITRKEYERVGVFSKIDAIKSKLKENISKYKKQKHPKTVELYAILSQLIALAEEPKGSSMTFNSTINNLENEFSKTLALAELEF